ncbi:hypothetical protein FKW77_000214 [Venturia effusa]|uniref:Uncharacterized protein n=1 Tax=Venturia effusa TaxID=50376 RepID=A0A517LQD6_9PEZI|nr:hypothetical protein FKW77_000214 [Venturia effusa]
MSRTNIAKHYSRILSQWPKDLIRPEVQFQKVIQTRAANAATIHEGEVTAELKNVNALYSLLDNRYSKKYPVPKRLLRPTSSPTYYDDLLVQLNQVPTQSRWSSLMARLKGLVRLT